MSVLEEFVNERRTVVDALKRLQAETAAELDALLHQPRI